MDDLISRAAAIDRIVCIKPTNPKQSDYTHGIEVGMAMAIVAIEEQEAAQPEQRWIPVTEALPPNSSYVLTTIHVPRRQSRVRSGYYQDGLFMNDNGDTWKATDKEVIAWRELPEPCRKGRRK